ncbi:NAD(P)/FAD-dependent oxidoreductase [Streptomyces sp. NPDC057638]|uniref:NAD(P)/FAD-dependent oxidoreductase n=1 Tax=Streptomyces sp. NPDC057638 TaxID=3346190 RepID=UPI00369E7AEE
MCCAATPDVRSRTMTRRIVVIGAGIVGSAVAEHVSRRSDCSVTVIDRAPPGKLPGSTGHAPGFVGLLGPDPALTELALRSRSEYRALCPRGRSAFDETGALELALSEEGATALTLRRETAAAAGLPARLVDAADAARLAPRLVDPTRVVAALRLPWDGVAHAGLITAALRARAVAAGCLFVMGTGVTAIDGRGGRVRGVRTATDSFAADDVVLACGIWGPDMAALAGVRLPLVPVVHPYVYGRRRSARFGPTPLVRWPEHSVYARDHGDRDGFGGSHHDALVVDVLTEQAQIRWPGGDLDDAVSAALELFPAEHAWHPSERIAGVLSLTPDKRPLLGQLGDVTGLWAAEAVWVTHAAGAAEALVAAMYDERPPPESVAASRFDGVPPSEIRRGAVAAYRGDAAPRSKTLE